MERAGAHVAEVRFGPRLGKAFAECARLEQWLEYVPAERLRSLTELKGAELRMALLDEVTDEVIDGPQSVVYSRTACPSLSLKSMALLS